MRLTSLRVRRVVVALLAVLVVGLAVVEAASMAIYGDLAHLPAVPALLAPDFGLTVMRRIGGDGMPAVLRTAYVQALVHRNHRAAAAAIVATLPDTIDTAEMRGQLAELAGEPSVALQAYVRAGDSEAAQRFIEARVAAGDLAAAAAYETLIVAALTGDGRAAPRGRALWRLGQITQLQAVADDSQRLQHERAALGMYERALAIAPNEETYLLAAGQQALILGDKALAARYYARALDAVPGSADARDGLQRSRL